MITGQPRRATIRREPLGQGKPSVGFDLGCTEKPQQGERVVQLVRVARVGPGLHAHACDRVRVESAQRCRGCGIEPPPDLHGLRAALLEGRVVEERVRPRV